jgi:carbon storage regulator CsrA
MLVLSRKKNESVVIGDGITITVVEIRGDKVRLGIVSPPEVPVHRQEIYELIHCPREEAPAAAPVQPDPAWLSWNDGTVVRLAQSIADKQAWHDLPVLADALEEAGCTDPRIVSHCRQPGEHARSCWVLDLLLRKT